MNKIFQKLKIPLIIVVVILIVLAGLYIFGHLHYLSAKLEALQNPKPQLKYNPYRPPASQAQNRPAITQTPQNIVPTVPDQDGYDISNYAGYIVRVVCSDGSPLESATVVMGSGTIYGLNKYVITNHHVVQGSALCKVGITDNVKNSPTRWYDATILTDIPSIDVALLKPTESIPADVSTVAYNLCKSNQIEIGDQIVVLGYPGVGGNTITATEGIVSGFDGYMVKTSAKMEHGNSGGGAFLVKNNCWFGIPTEVNKGELESLGYIINYVALQENAASNK